LRDYAIGLAFFLLGLSVFIFVFVKELLRFGSLLAVLDRQTGGHFREFMFADVPKLFWRLNYLFLLAYQYPSLALVFLFLGAYLLVVKRQPFDLFLIIALIPQIVWSANYFVWDMYAFALPVYVLSAPVIARGLLLVADRKKILVLCSISLVLPVFLYKNTQHIPLISRIVKQYPDVDKVEDIFDPVKYFMDPDKSRFDAVDRFVVPLFDILPENATFYDDVHNYPIYYYYQRIRHLRTDISCPINWTLFWGKQDERRVAANIETLIGRGESVYVSKVVLRFIGHLLKDQRCRAVQIHGQTIYQLY
jgi:hypothetical protein